MVKVSFQNNKNWASYKCLVRKSEKIFKKNKLYGPLFYGWGSTI